MPFASISRMRSPPRSSSRRSRTFSCPGTAYSADSRSVSAIPEMLFDGDFSLHTVLTSRRPAGYVADT